MSGSTPNTARCAARPASLAAGALAMASDFTALPAGFLLLPLARSSAMAWAGPATPCEGLVGAVDGTSDINRL